MSLGYKSMFTLCNHTSQTISFSKPAREQVAETEIENVNVRQFLTDLNGTMVCRSPLPFKIFWLHLSGFVIELTNAAFCIVTISTNIKRLATFISDAFKLTFKLINNGSRVHDMTK